MARPRLAVPHDFKLKFTEDGVIGFPMVAELYAIALTQGEEPDVAWHNAGGSQSEVMRKMRAAIEADPEWQPYLDRLMVVHMQNLADPVFGEAICLINIAFKEARAKRMRNDMMEMVKLRLRAAEGVADREARVLKAAERATPSPDPEPKRPVGKPAAESPQSKVDTRDMRQRLLDKGVAVLPQSQDEDEG